MRVIKLMRLAGRVAQVGTINVCKTLVRKPEAKRPLRRPRHRWEGNIKVDLQEIGWEVVDWLQLA
jgi:hypothetical protein